MHTFATKPPTNAPLPTTTATPLSNRTAQAAAYWRAPFKALASARALVEYVVLDIEPVRGNGGAHGGGAYGAGGSGGGAGGSGRFQLAEATVARASDFGRNETTYFVRTHLGHVLHPGAWTAFDCFGLPLGLPWTALPATLTPVVCLCVLLRRPVPLQKSTEKPWRRVTMKTIDLISSDLSKIRGDANRFLIYVWTSDGAF